MSSARPSATTSDRGGAPVWGPSTLAVAESAMAVTAVARMTTPMCWTLIGSPVRCTRHGEHDLVWHMACKGTAPWTSMPQNFPQRREARYLIAERFECGGSRDREEPTRDAPDEPPKQHTDHDRERVDLQTAGIDKWRQHVVLQHRDGEVADGRKQRVADAGKRREAGDREESHHRRRAEVG